LLQRICRLLALFCRPNSAEQCPVSGVKQPCRRNLETAEFGPNCDISAQNPNNPNLQTRLRDAQEAARKVGQQILVVHAGSESDIDMAFATIVQQRRRRSLSATIRFLAAPAVSKSWGWQRVTRFLQVIASMTWFGPAAS
jgi:hypothetical protein